MNTAEGTAAAVLFDNVRALYKEKETSVTAIGYDNLTDVTEISPDAKTIDVYLNANVDESTVTADNVSIDGGAKISGILYDS